MDSSTSGVDGFLETTTLGNLNGHSPVQRHPPVVGTPLPDPQAWASSCRLPEELHVTAACVVACARTTRRAKRRVRPVRVVEISVGDLQVLAHQDPTAVLGVVDFDRWPPLLPVSLDLSGSGLLSGLPPAASASVGVPPNEHGLSISGGGGTLMDCPLEDAGTDLEDELPTPDGSPSTDASKLVLGHTSPGIDLELTGPP